MTMKLGCPLCNCNMEIKKIFVAGNISYHVSHECDEENEKQEYDYSFFFIGPTADSEEEAVKLARKTALFKYLD